MSLAMRGAASNGDFLIGERTRMNDNVATNSRQIALNRDICSVLVFDNPVTLTARDFDLLCFLVDNGDRVVGHREIATRVFGASAGDTALLVRVHVCTLRRALGPLRGLLETVRGRGYRFVGRAEAPPASGNDNDDGEQAVRAGT
jgi:DNA-binding response OmpR family regulator